MIAAVQSFAVWKHKRGEVASVRKEFCSAAEDYPSIFKKCPGDLLVQGAGSEEANGFYDQRDSATSIPEGLYWSHLTQEQWRNRRGDRPWYQGEDCIIVYNTIAKQWFIRRNSGGFCRYYSPETSAREPPREG